MAEQMANFVAKPTFRVISKNSGSYTVNANTYGNVSCDFSNDMDDDEHIISVSLGGAGSSALVPRGWYITSRTVAGASLRNLTNSSVTVADGANFRVTTVKNANCTII